MKKEYEAPAINMIGSLRELTQSGPPYNKVGYTPDIYTAETAGAVIGSLTAPH